MRFTASSIDSFICYYLHLGFEAIFIYADDPHDPLVGIARRYPAERVSVIPRDAALEREYPSLPSWRRLALFAPTEVQARQQLHCEHCMAACAARGLDWLLHVDSDELLWLPRRAAALQHHLRHLSSRGALLFTYRNLEAVPERIECSDPFRELSLLKQHPSQLDAAAPRVAAAMAYWEERGGGEFFRFYSNGKSIARVGRGVRVCASVHEWELPSEAGGAHGGFTNNPRLRLSNYIPHQRVVVDEACGGVILHFPVCSFAAFWAKRWAALGYASPNHRFRGATGGFDQQAHALALRERRAEAEALYRRAMMIESEAEVARQVGAGVCVRMSELAPFVEGARAYWMGRRREAVGAGEAKMRAAVLLAMEEGVDEAVRMAREAQRLLQRGLVEAAELSCPPSTLFRRLLSVLLPRVAASSLSLLPSDRLSFDLTGYCKHPYAAKAITAAQVAQLLREGVVHLPSAVPLDICAALDAEARRLDGELLDASTTRSHARSAWIHFDEAPPRAPPPAKHVGPPLPPEWYGACVPTSAESFPALCGAVRFLRGLAAAIEDLSDLRLAVPRAAQLHLHLEGGTSEARPPNSGWPDTNIEVSAALFLGAAEAHGTVECHPHEGRVVHVPAAPGGILLTLARRVRKVVPPAAGGEARRWLTMQIFSCWVRSGDGDRILGMSQACAPRVEGPAGSLPHRHSSPAMQERMNQTREAIQPIVQSKRGMQLAKAT
ncbi:hypothetical protein AB1Y20_014064 [Prymnesium parvum]|uniref:Glycosyltransferase family 92 protein n=1 Tax=Prymnesium parvum TaxID=97485 RepID=A0AB34IF21_PRYPA